MGLWDRLFGRAEQRDDVSAVVAGAELVADSQLNQAALREADAAVVDGLRRRVDQLELIIEGLVRELESRDRLDVSALKARIAALDALDGQADQRLGADTPRRLQE